MENNKQYILAVEPDELLSMLEKKKQKLQKMEPYIKKIYEFLKQNAVISDSFLSENSFEMFNEL